MRGYFGIGAEGISKKMNVGNLMRSANAFGASFVFTIRAHHRARIGSDTSRATTHLPYYKWESAEEMVFPNSCKLVGIEFIEEAIDLPSFCHPLNAAYILGPEKGELSANILSRCDQVVKIPTRFCINVGMAGAIVMYDRVKSLGRFAPKPLSEIGRVEELPSHKHGEHHNYRTRKS